jgi:hypothetical protein
MVKGGYNPFNQNSVVTPNLFAGRTDTTLEICRKLSQIKHNMPASFFIHGERGIGKTALAKLIKSYAVIKDPTLYALNLLTSYYSLEEGQDLSSVLQESVNILTDQMDSTLVADIGKRLGGIFKNGKFTIGAFGAQLGIDMITTETQKDITIKDQTVSILSNILKAVRDNGNNDGILIIIDEIHNLLNLETAASVLRNIVTTLDVDNIGQVSFLLIGYDDDVEKFFSVDTSARRTFDLHRLDVMPPEDASQVLVKGFEAVGYEYDKKALEKNILAAGGYPHSIQVLGHNLIEADEDRVIHNNDWNQAIFKSSQELQTKEFSKMFSFGRPLKERDKILIALANAGKPLDRKTIKEKVPSCKNPYKEIATLKSMAAIKENQDKTISLHSQLFRTAILFEEFRVIRQRIINSGKVGGTV